MQSASLDPRVRAALARRVRGEAAPAAKPPQSLPSVAPGEPVPLTATQYAIWLHVQVDQPDSPLYNLATSVRVRGRLNHPHLLAALSGVLQRQQLLRSRVVNCGGQPHLLVDDAAAIRPELIDLGSLGDAAEAAMQADARRLSAEPFHLARGPLIRLRVYRLSDDEASLQVVAHHLVFDGWSFGVLLQELVQHYTALAKGQGNPPATPTVQHAQVAIGQKAAESAPAYRASLDHWRTSLKDHVLGPLLPTDRPAVLRPSYPAGRCWFWLGEAERRALSATARGLGVSDFAVFTAALAACLHRFGGCEDLSFVVPVSLRDSLELQQLIGPLIGATLLRSTVDAAQPFRDLARAIHARAVGNLPHVSVPLESALRLTASAGSAHRPQVALYWDDTPVPDAFQVQGLMAYREALPNLRTGFALTVIVQSNLIHGRSLVTFEYAADQFEQRSIDALSATMRRLLVAALAAPQTCIGQLPLLSPEDAMREALRGQPGNVAPPASLLLDRVAREAARRPDAVAVRSAEACMSYRELADASDRLARALRAAGLVAEERVGIQLGRGVGLPAALLGVMKAGGAYLPLDPELPATRLAYMCADAGLRLLGVDDEPAARSAPPGLQPLPMQQLLDGNAEQAGGSAAGPGAGAPGALAYVLYTSGSTGQPKAVMVTHEALTNLLHDFVERLALDETTTMLASTALSFDIAGLELFAPLMVGAEVLMAPSDAEGMAAAVAALDGASRQAPVMQATPTRWASLLAQGWRPRPGQCLLCGGEALSAELAGRLLQSGARLLNVYGPTETTIWSTAWAVLAQAPVRIGQPIANTVVRILDAAMQPVPPGAIGELHLGGTGLARGYLSRPALTATRFVPDPYDAGRRLYRTGDLARWSADGQLEFLGRADGQVKVRGHRIELGEIESLAARQPAVQTAVASVDVDAHENARIALHLLAMPGRTLDAQLVQDALRSELPVYMWPASVHELERLPLTPGGKVDRRALAAMARSGSGRQRRLAYEPPQTATERQLVEIWAETLGMPEDQIGRADDFFDLGGHSLMAMLAVAHIDDRLGLQLPAGTLLERHSLSELARQLDLQAWLSHPGVPHGPGDAHVDNLSEGSL